MIDTSRQEKAIFNEFKTSFDKKNLSKKILLIGCGGVGSPLAELLVRGGFSNITLVDFDIVDKTNLQRQNYLEKDIGEAKVDALKRRLIEINPQCNIKTISEKITKNSNKEIFKDIEIILDGTHIIKTKHTINYFAKKYNCYWIYNGAIKTQSISCLVSPEDDKLELILPKNFQEQGCEDGVLGSTTFITASICYNILLQYFTGNKENKLHKFDMIKGLYVNMKF